MVWVVVFWLYNYLQENEILYVFKRLRIWVAAVTDFRLDLFSQGKIYQQSFLLLHYYNHRFAEEQTNHYHFLC